METSKLLNDVLNYQKGFDHRYLSATCRIREIKKWMIIYTKPVEKSSTGWLKTMLVTLIIGKNKHWKTAIKIGKRNNQNFVQIPHARLIDLIQYKFEQENGIVIIHEESYTSKASVLDLDPLPAYRKRG